MLNGGMFNHDDLRIGCRSIADGQYEITSSYGRNWESFYYISVILDLHAYGPPYTLLLTKGHMFLRTYEGTRDEEEYMYTDGSSTDDNSSDGDYS